MEKTRAASFWSVNESRSAKGFQQGHVVDVETGQAEVEGFVIQVLITIA